MPKKRKTIFNNSKAVVATPQTIESDLKNQRISLEDTCLLVVDECHRSKERFANTKVAEIYMKSAKNPRILALTASPGATKEKVEEVCKNLHIRNIELRTELDKDLSPHIQKKENINIRVELPKNFKQIQGMLKSQYKCRLGDLKKYGITKPPSVINKTDLLKFQTIFQKRIKSGDFLAYRGVSDIAAAIKLNHATGLIETQSASALKSYFEKLEEETSKASKNLLNNKTISNAKKLTERLVMEKALHPKLIELKKIIRSETESEITIIFANYRATVSEIKTELEKINNAKPAILVGQKEGVTQKEQLATIEKFNRGNYNILICTSIGEEGLSIGSLDLAIFYDHTASEIRKIQRSGRVGRIKPGKIINLITKKTLDEAMIWTAKRKEQKMHNLLNYMKRNLKNENNS